MKFSVLTLFPDQVKNFLSESIIGRAEEKGILHIDTIDIRDFSGNRYGKVDDTLFGGGTGMLMQCEPVYQAFTSLYDPEKEVKPHCVFMSPKGSVLTQEKAKELSAVGEAAYSFTVSTQKKLSDFPGRSPEDGRAAAFTVEIVAPDSRALRRNRSHQGLLRQARMPENGTSGFCQDPGVKNRERGGIGQNAGAL